MAGRPLTRKAVRALARCLDERDVDGRRRAVPVFGNGLHVQAFSETSDRAGDPFTAALKTILADLPPATRRRLGRISHSHQGFYDQRLFGSAAMKALGRELATYASRGADLPLYQDLRIAEFQDVLTTCIDDTLPLAVAATRREPPTTWDDDELYRRIVSGTSAFRLGTRQNPTDIWQINGSVGMPRSIRMGTREHAETIADFESQRTLLMNGWRTPSGSLRRPVEFGYVAKHFAFNWFKQFMVRPLVFVGTSLDPSDWPMWWLLHQRARVLSVFDADDRPDTFVLAAADEASPHLAGNPAHLQLVEFTDFDEMWTTLRLVLDA